MSKHLGQLIGLLCVATVGFGCVDGAEEPTDETRIAMAVSQAQALRRTQEALGATITGAQLAPSLVALGDQTVPCLSAALKGKTTWQVQAHDVTIEANGGVNPYITSMTILLSPETGQVMKIKTAWPKELAPITPAPPVEIHATQMMAAGGQRFSGLPKDPPAVSFASALELAYGGATNAKEIIAYYVLYSSRTGQITDRPVWVVQLRGLPPFMPRVPRGADPASIPEDARNHLPTIIDAQTGEFITANTVPQPVAG